MKQRDGLAIFRILARGAGTFALVAVQAGGNIHSAD